MKKVLIFLLLSLFLPELAYAIPFTASLSPQNLTEGVENQQLNFTVVNQGSIPILQLNISLPAGIIFTGISDSNTTNPFFSSTIVPSWWNASSIGLITPSEAVTFTIYVDVSHISGDYEIGVTTVDELYSINSTKLSIKILDLLPPAYPNLTVSPPSGTSYAPSKEYKFTIKWSDNVAISTVQIEHNFTGTFVNESMEKNDSTFTKKFSDLRAGKYRWRIFANDTSNNVASTPEFDYIISQAPSDLNISLNSLLNQDIAVKVNENVNIEVFSSCDQPTCVVTIKRGTTILGTIASKVGVPVTYTDTIISTGLTMYLITVSGNENYTRAEKSYWVYASPNFNVLKKFPEVYSPTSLTSINITFESDPQLTRVLIGGNWEGSWKNYTMTKSLNTYSYIGLLSAGTFEFKIYADAEGKIFKLYQDVFSISKAKPTISLRSQPSWTLDEPNQTNVSCSINPPLPVKLYRNGTEVSNPDINTFPAGSTYIYLCNSTATANYESVTAMAELTIKPPPVANLDWKKVPEVIDVVENSSTSISIQVKNTGTVAQNVLLSILGIDEKLYSISPTNITIQPEEIGELRVRFVGLEEINEHEGAFVVSSPNVSLSKNFTLRILPSPERILEINYTISLLKIKLLNLKSKFYEVKPEIRNATPIEAAFGELESTLNQIARFSNTSDYINLYRAQGYFESLLNETENLIATSLRERIGITINPLHIALLLTGVAGIVLAKFFYPKKKVKLPRGDVVKYMELLEGKKRKPESEEKT